MVPVGGLEPTCWDGRLAGDSNPDLHGLNVPRLPIAARARPATLGTWNASSTPRPNMDRCCSPAHRHRCGFQRPHSSRVGGRQGTRTQALPSGRTTVSKTQPPSDLAHSSSGLEAKTKRPSRGSPQKACFSMSAVPLGRLTLHAAIERAGPAIGPRVRNESRHTPGHSWRRGAIR
jgi:hypothetical protein